MKLKKTTIGALCVAAAIAVGGIQWFAVNQASSAVEPVVRAKVEIPSGTKITASMLETVNMGKLGLPSNITCDAAQVAGTYTKTDIQAHDIITGGKVAGHAPDTALSDGKMLYSVAVKNLADSVSGKLQSGDIVQAAFREFAAKTLPKEQEAARPSLRKQLQKLVEMVRNAPHKSRNKEQKQSR